jgi:hypothetical protein
MTGRYPYKKISIFSGILGLGLGVKVRVRDRVRARVRVRGSLLAPSMITNHSASSNFFQLDNIYTIHIMIKGRVGEMVRVRVRLG